MFNKTHQEGSALISALDRNYFTQDEQPYRVSKVPIISDANNYYKIVVKKILEERGIFWVKLELIHPVLIYIEPEPDAFEAKTEFPINLIRRAFLISMTECNYVRLSRNI
jgi:hypothetical protein